MCNVENMRAPGDKAPVSNVYKHVSVGVQYHMSGAMVPMHPWPRSKCAMGTKMWFKRSLGDS
jgi:hypothetical protein